MLFNSKNSFSFFCRRPSRILFARRASRARRRSVGSFWYPLCSTAWWRPVNVLIIGPSILINFALASIPVAAEPAAKVHAGMSTSRPGAGDLFNVAFLGFFKYTDFIYGTINDIFGANLVLRHIILPLGISFITFQKIALLIDVQAGRVKSFTFQDYCTFVLFFPQLIAGPIVHYREMMPQFAAALPFRQGELRRWAHVIVFRFVQEGSLCRQHSASCYTDL